MTVYEWRRLSKTGNDLVGGVVNTVITTSYDTIKWRTNHRHDIVSCAGIKWAAERRSHLASPWCPAIRTTKEQHGVDVMFFLSYLCHSIFSCIGVTSILNNTVIFLMHPDKILCTCHIILIFSINLRRDPKFCSLHE